MPNTTNMRFNVWLRRTMQQKGITGTAMAAKLDVSNSMVSHWTSPRNSTRVPSIRTLSQMAIILDVDPLTLYVTSGRLTSEDAGLEAFPMPSPEIERKSFEVYIDKHFTDITVEQRDRLMETFEDIVN